MEKIGILYNRGKSGAASLSDAIRWHLSKRGVEVVATDGEGEIPDGISCLLVVGGDGTLLRAARRVVGRELPLLGVNLGTLGYLAEVEASQFRMALDRLLEGKYTIEKRMMLEGEIFRKGVRIAEDIALNDVVILRNGPLRLLEFITSVNGERLTDYRSDGVILSTATGATGYTLSVGGPIVTPEANLMIMTPIAAHTLAARSIILRGRDVVRVELGVGNGYLPPEASVFFDGNEKLVSIEAGDVVEIRRAMKKTNIIKLSDASFLDVLRRKLADG